MNTEKAPESANHNIDDLLRVMQRLRDPVHGCPWDREQNFDTIVPSTLEECYELAAAIEARDWPHVADELGDLLFQVVFYAQLGSERELFDFSSVVHGLADKLLRRHPHVFSDGQIEGVADGAIETVVEKADVKQQWEQIKAEERAGRDQHSALDDVPLALPALVRAQKLQKRAARVGFDWPRSEDVLEKLHEEIAELGEAVAQRDESAIEDELGDLLFTAVNLSRHLRVDAETALRRASAKFEARFRAMEAEAASHEQPIATCSVEALELLWEQAERVTAG